MDDRIVEVSRWAKGIERLHQCIARRFRSAKPRQRVLDYLKGPHSPLARKKGWQLGERVGDATHFGLSPRRHNHAAHPDQWSSSDSRYQDDIRPSGSDSSAESEISGSQWNDPSGERGLVDRDVHRS